ncbi:MerR family transcriptional regulator [Rhodococcus daqingensis]|uniref:MerR family transcriptional regulator n=1 Tax=Rhodococcus daqingensis TaxID=2479363 RepID=A0ABW2RSG5_9NOCA
MRAHDRRVEQYTVGDVARMSGVSVRTLHHYDEIGLLSPQGRTAANHRRYSAADLDRLRRILFYRALDFGLDDIAAVLADPNARTDDHLRRQHRLLRQRQARTQALLGAVEREIEARRAGISLSPEEQWEIFGTEHFAEYSSAAGRWWDHPDRRQGKQHPTAAYTRDDWLEIKSEADANIAAFAAAIAAGEPATGPVAMRAAEEHRAHIARWFHDCSHDQHVEVAASYVSEPTDVEEWDSVAPGFARYVHDAILANARRARDTGQSTV